MALYHPNKIPKIFVFHGIGQFKYGGRQRTESIQDSLKKKKKWGGRTCFTRCQVRSKAVVPGTGWCGPRARHRPLEKPRDGRVLRLHPLVWGQREHGVRSGHPPSSRQRAASVNFVKSPFPPVKEAEGTRKPEGAFPAVAFLGPRWPSTAGRNPGPRWAAPLTNF